MKIGPFIQHVAQATLVAEATVKIIARFLREAGYLTTTPTKARGVNGPEMVPRDAARLLLALLVTTSPARAVEAYEKVSRMIAFRGNAADAAERITSAGFACASGETVEEALTAFMTPTTEVNGNLSLVMRAKAGNVIGLDCTLHGLGGEDIGLMFRRDHSEYADQIEDLIRRWREPLTPEDAGRLAEMARQELALAKAGGRPWLEPRGFVDERSIDTNSLLWLRWKAFEEG